MWQIGGNNIVKCSFTPNKTQFKILRFFFSIQKKLKSDDFVGQNMTLHNERNRSSSNSFITFRQR